MNVLYFGDVYAKPGRDAVKIAIRQITAQRKIDFIIVNGENMCHGNGIMPEMADEFFALGVDVITTGNHAWDQKQIIPYINQSERLIRPLNYPSSSDFPCPGLGSTIVTSRTDSQLKLAVIQVMGRVFMDALDCPFRTAEAEVRRLRGMGQRLIFVDFHGEASSEKQAFAHFLDGRVAAVVGSHSHVQTADERILPGRTAAITDVGMSGCFDSVIGVKKEISIQRFITKRPHRYEPAEGPGGYGCVIVGIDEKTGLATGIERIREAVAKESA